MLKLVVDQRSEASVRSEGRAKHPRAACYKTAKRSRGQVLHSVWQILRRKAGILEFTDEFVASEPVQRMMERVTPVRSGHQA